jgi:hypothetical protein
MHNDANGFAEAALSLGGGCHAHRSFIVPLTNPLRDSPAPRQNTPPRTADRFAALRILS